MTTATNNNTAVASTGAQVEDHWSSTRYVTNASFVPVLGAPVLELLNPQASETILDLGAGDGVLTIDLAKKCKKVVAIDASADMINAAIKIGCEDARVVDGHDLEDHEDLANGQFDAVFTNAALHWMKKDPSKVVRGVAKCLRPGGRFVGEFGGFTNCGEIRVAIHQALLRRGVDPEPLDPWYFPSAESYQQILESQGGFRVDYIQLIPRPTRLNTDIAGWIETFGFTFLRQFSDEVKKEIAMEMQEALRPAYCREDGVWFVNYTRLRFSATKI